MAIKAPTVKPATSGVKKTPVPTARPQSKTPVPTPRPMKGATSVPVPTPRPDRTSISAEAKKPAQESDRVGAILSGLQADKPAEAGAADPNAGALKKLDEVTSRDHKDWGGQTTTPKGEPIKDGHKENENSHYKKVGEYWNDTALKGTDGKDRDQPWSAAYISSAHKRAGVTNFPPLSVTPLTSRTPSTPAKQAIRTLLTTDSNPRREPLRRAISSASVGKTRQPPSTTSKAESIPLTATS